MKHSDWDDEEWGLWDADYRALTGGRPGYQEFWRDNRSTFDRAFLAHLDAGVPATTKSE